MMEKEFVSYEIALRLKELGFNESCFGYYNNMGNYLEDSGKANHNCNKPGMNGRYCTAPLRQQVFKWFRDNNSLYSEILLDKTTYPKYAYEISLYSDFGNYEKLNGEFFLYSNYEEAEIVCIDRLIEIVKGKNGK